MDIDEDAKLTCMLQETCGSGASATNVSFLVAQSDESPDAQKAMRPSDGFCGVLIVAPDGH